VAVKRTTSRDVAKRAGVSQTTVSFVLNNAPGARISEEVRQRVWQAARELDYHPNAAAQSLRRRRTHTIGLIIPDNTNPHFWQVAKGVESKADETGYSVLLTSTDLELDKERRALESLKRQRVDGLILQLFYPDQVMSEVEAMRAQGHAIVTIGRFSPDMDGVVPDYGRGCALLMEHLLQLGHRRIAFVFGSVAADASPSRMGSGRGRLAAYRAAVCEHSLDDDEGLLQRCGPTPEDACEATARLLSLPVHPTAIVALNDFLTIGVYKTVLDAGLRIPEDVSVAGFDDIPMARYLSPPLTTVRAQAERLGEKAYELFHQRLEDADSPLQHILLPTSLVIRESTGPAPRRT